MAQNITLLGASYPDVPAVDLPKTGGGTARFTDVTDTTASAADVAQGKYFYAADGTRTQGTGTGGGGTGAISIVDTPDAAGGTVRTITAVDISDTTAVAADVLNSKWFYTAQGVKTQGTASGGGGATQHTIHLEFSDSTDTDIEVDYDDALIGTMITSYAPNPWTYNNKMVVEAQLDGVTWYEYSPVPIGVQLIDYTQVSADMAIGSDGEAFAQQWYYASDYTPIETGMNFSYRAGIWYYIGFYDKSKAVIGTFYVYNYATPDPSDSNTGYGNILGTNIPSNAAYLRLCGTGADSSHMSLIRTA